MKCVHCQNFFSQFTCSMDRYLECDCPKCQGYCECADLEERDNQEGDE